MKIGVFDSGVGGLSVLDALLKASLFDELIYYGDTARVPYGNKDKETIVKFSLEAVEWFKKQKVDMGDYKRCCFHLAIIAAFTLFTLSGCGLKKNPYYSIHGDRSGGVVGAGLSIRAKR